MCSIPTAPNPYLQIVHFSRRDQPVCYRIGFRWERQPLGSCSLRCSALLSRAQAPSGV
jgi:hypothetical protein